MSERVCDPVATVRRFRQQLQAFDRDLAAGRLDSWALVGSQALTQQAAQQRLAGFERWVANTPAAHRSGSRAEIEDVRRLLVWHAWQTADVFAHMLLAASAGADAVAVAGIFRRGFVAHFDAMLALLHETATSSPVRDALARVLAAVAVAGISLRTPDRAGATRLARKLARHGEPAHVLLDQSIGAAWEVYRAGQVSWLDLPRQVARLLEDDGGPAEPEREVTLDAVPGAEFAEAAATAIASHPETRAKLEAALRRAPRLSPRERQVFGRHYLKGESLEHLAAALNLKRGTINQTLKRAKRKLAAC